MTKKYDRIKTEPIPLNGTRKKERSCRHCWWHYLKFCKKLALLLIYLVFSSLISSSFLSFSLSDKIFMRCMPWRTILLLIFLDHLFYPKVEQRSECVVHSLYSLYVICFVRFYYKFSISFFIGACFYSYFGSFTFVHHWKPQKFTVRQVLFYYGACPSLFFFLPEMNLIFWSIVKKTENLM